LVPPPPPLPVFGVDGVALEEDSFDVEDSFEEDSFDDDDESDDADPAFAGSFEEAPERLSVR
jgi:hypothetical protein